MNRRGFFKLSAGLAAGAAASIPFPCGAAAAIKHEAKPSALRPKLTMAQRRRLFAMVRGDYAEMRLTPDGPKRIKALRGPRAVVTGKVEPISGKPGVYTWLGPVGDWRMKHIECPD